jgi:HD-GYP domain-containing protein (c-di-GMP phosphodiesterase class II)
MSFPHYNYINNNELSLCPHFSRFCLVPLEARIMCIADIFTALREKRPYNEPFSKEKILSIMENMANSNALDSRIISLLKDNFEDIESICIDNQYIRQKEFAKIQKLYN